MLNSTSPTPEITITGAIEAVRIWTTETVGMDPLIRDYALQGPRPVSRLHPYAMKWSTTQCWNESVRHRSSHRSSCLLPTYSDGAGVNGSNAGNTGSNSGEILTLPGGVMIFRSHVE